jgi:hypothetical protein
MTAASEYRERQQPAATVAGLSEAGEVSEVIASYPGNVTAVILKLRRNVFRPVFDHSPTGEIVLGRPPLTARRHLEIVIQVVR